MVYIREERKASVASQGTVVEEELTKVNSKIAANTPLINKGSGTPRLLCLLYDLVLQNSQRSRIETCKHTAKRFINYWTGSNDTAENDRKQSNDDVPPSPFSGPSGTSWTLGAVVRVLETTFHVKPTSMNIIKGLTSLPLRQLSRLTEAMIEKTLAHHFPVNDRQNTFEATMKILGNLGPEHEDLIFAVTQPLMNTFYDDLTKPATNVTGFNFRTADGSYNSMYFPDAGRSGTNYTRYVIPRHITNRNLPPPALVFEKLLKRRKFEPHPNGINMLMLYIAILITHDLFYTSPKNPMRNMTSAYADLSPLYGYNKYDQDSIRLKKGGLLKPDCWFDKRLMMQPPGVPALLVLFSRNHNYIAKKLLEINENDRFSYGPGKMLATEADQDQLLFQTARLINNGCYVNIILHEYVRTIVGTKADAHLTLNPVAVPTKHVYGNIMPIEFNYIYRWHMAIGQQDEAWIDTVMNRLGRQFMELRSVNTVSLPLEGAAVYPPATEQTDQSLFDSMLPAFNDTFVHASKEELTRGLPIPGAHRSKDGTFADRDIARILRNGFNQVASVLGGGQNTPASLMHAEIGGIMQSRLLQTCTFNEFRRHFNLQELKSFEDFSHKPEVQEALRELYGSPDNVELYTGLMVEETKKTGLCLPYTMGRAILSDAVNLLRNDRIVNFEMTPANLTTWGAQYAAGDPNLQMRVFPSMISNLLPNANVDGSPAFSDEELRTLLYVPRA